jgi:hypothetical protein
VETESRDKRKGCEERSKVWHRENKKLGFGLATTSRCGGGTTALPNRIASGGSEEKVGPNEEIPHKKSRYGRNKFENQY